MAEKKPEAQATSSSSAGASGPAQCESSAENIMSILDQMADTVQMDYSTQFSTPEDLKGESQNSKDSEPSSSGLHSSSSFASEKDTKYWERRRKNNLAAKKSRDARKIRENQLQCKVACLENANTILRTKLDIELRKNLDLSEKFKVVKEENDSLKKKMAFFNDSTATEPSV